MKTYTEKQLKLALEYQKAVCYQKVGKFLINGEKPNIEGALNYLADDEIVNLAEIDNVCKN
ncbi:MAG TPA: hypothetical protein VK668_11985 [Mucilaginibacter sp.]|nr:hypothetical protein [Mucilaginibacter sp.]